MLNTYTLEVYKKQKNPCFVVTVNHVMLSGVYFFNSLKDANEFVHNTQKELERFGELHYNMDGVTDKRILDLIKTVISCENYHIGENGKTYWKD